MLMNHLRAHARGHHHLTSVSSRIEHPHHATPHLYSHARCRTRQRVRRHRRTRCRHTCACSTRPGASPSEDHLHCQRPDTEKADTGHQHGRSCHRQHHLRQAGYYDPMDAEHHLHHALAGDHGRHRRAPGVKRHHRASQQPHRGHRHRACQTHAKRGCA